MSTLTVSIKGQVTLPKNLLKHLGVRPGEKIAVAKLPGGRLVVSARPTGKISDVFGLLKKKGGPSLSIEDQQDHRAELGRQTVIGLTWLSLDHLWLPADICGPSSNGHNGR